MDWVRGDSVGSGSFATVSLALPRNSSGKFSSPTAVKSTEVVTSYWLKNEKQVLDRLGTCRRIIRCYGEDYTFENGDEYYNLFLEYAAGGSLSDELRRHGGGIPEPEIRRYAKSIVEGLSHIHASGFVHCDIKLQNILVFEDGEVKIADFGLAKEAGEEEEEQGKKRSKRFECRGTPICLSPESVTDGECESPADIWALGCAVVEMVTGKPAWNFPNDSSIWSLLLRIGVGEEVPLIPDDISKEGKDFLEKCFVKDPRKRWTAEMLLNHPFVSCDTVSLKSVNEQSGTTTTSPRSHFDFPDWVSSVTGSVPSSPESDEPPQEWNFSSSCSVSPVDRLRRLATDQIPAGWPESDGWTSVRWN